ncbi:MAG: glycoside hydrolase family 5 protein [Lentisphaerae bacterium]|nr:glycoside hydrolase family 5 protein [Lentisphaerota bacterium]
MFVIQADSTVHEINNCKTLWGVGSIRPDDDRLTWRGEAPIVQHGWVEVGIGFTAVSNGSATISFSRNAWKDGLEIKNLKGRHVKIEGDGLERKLTLCAGRQSAISFQVRAKSIPGAVEMPRLPNTGTPAHKAVDSFKRGVNLGNSLEVPPDENWKEEYTAADMKAIKQEGFDHVRIPCAWHHHTGKEPNFKIKRDFFKQVNSLVTAAINNNLAVIVNWHHFDDFMADPKTHTDQLIKGWEQIAEYFAEHSGVIAFELLNEPCDNAETFVMNGIYARLIKVIRQKAPDNTLFIGPGSWNSVMELENLWLPGNESNIVVTVHDYEPFLYTHQGASWNSPQTDTTNICFPGPPAKPVTPAHEYTGSDTWVANWFDAYNTLPAEWNPNGIFALDRSMKIAVEWSNHFGRPVHVSEWGCIADVCPKSRAVYHAVKRRFLEDMQLPWTLWSWKSNFRYWDTEEKGPMPGLRHALFP